MRSRMSESSGWHCTIGNIIYQPVGRVGCSAGGNVIGTIFVTSLLLEHTGESIKCSPDCIKSVESWPKSCICSFYKKKIKINPIDT